MMRLLLLGLAAGLLVAGCADGGSDAGERGEAEVPPVTEGRADGGPLLESPPPAPDPMREVLGEYVGGGDTVSVLEEGGRLRFLRWSGGRRAARLEANGTLVVEGMERPVVVRRGAGGGVAGLVVDERRLTRIGAGAEDGGTFRIDPIRPVDELRSEALAAEPPPEEGAFRPSELVELVELDSTIRLDVRYATTNNFMGARFYTEPRAFLQRPAAEAVVRAHRWLREQGFGVVIYDAYRPWHVTKMFWDATPDSLKGFVADPSGGSRHNRGAAVDLGLYDVETGEVVAMPSGYDEFTPRAAADYPGGTMRQRWHRRLLRLAMESQGFTVYGAEWWHFDHRDWRRYRIADRRFEELEDGPGE